MPSRTSTALAPIALLHYPICSYYTSPKHLAELMTASCTLQAYDHQQLALSQNTAAFLKLFFNQLVVLHEYLTAHCFGLRRVAFLDPFRDAACGVRINDDSFTAFVHASVNVFASQDAWLF